MGPDGGGAVFGPGEKKRGAGVAFSASIGA
jgi:hypothetical protein